MTAVQILGFIGALLAIGFLADYLFRKISFPDILILLALGYLIGPVFKIIDPAQIAPSSQIIASLALVIILFNGGLDLKLAPILSSAPRTIILVVLGIVASTAAITALAYHLLGWDLMNSLLLGAILSGTSPSIVMPLVNRAKVPEKVSSVLSLESAFDGALVIVIALVILEVITGGQTGNEAAMVGQAIGIKFAIGVGIGVAAGFLWLWVLTLIEGETFDDILTLAVVFLLYFAVESIDGSGVIFALVFGLILGNGVEVANFLHIKRTVEVHDMMKKFHSQMSFLIKTFFFVYLGLMMTFDDLDVVLTGVLLSFALLFVRYFVVLLTSIGNSTLLKNSGFLTTMLPRGLSAAVVAEVVVAAGIANASSYPNIIMIVIVTTVVISALGIPIFARKLPEEVPAELLEEAPAELAEEQPEPEDNEPPSQMPMSD
jgi:cell volume regulation protein A